MAKVFKNVFISLCGAFAFMIAGFFFAGCGVDYTKISLTSSVSSVELEVGESVDVEFTIENYQSGFSNEVSITPRSDETEAVFECSSSSIKYLSDSRFRLTIKALNGGHGQLVVKTLEAGKECVVDVNVTQYSYSMSTRNNILYVSNDTDFVPQSSIYEFDTHTTYTNLSHYYLQEIDFDENSFVLEEINVEIDLTNNKADGTAKGTDKNGQNVEADITQFDRVKLNDNNKLELYLNDVLVKTIDSLPNSFNLLSVYDYSLTSKEYQNIVFSFAEVNVLPSLKVEVKGGYLVGNTVEFGDVASNIVIVPNNSEKRQYILRMEMIDSIVDSEIAFTKSTSNNLVNVDFYDEEMNDDSTENIVHYWIISQNSQNQGETSLEFNVFYRLAADILDENVNVTLDYLINIEIAPSAITVNGTSEPDPIYLYNSYKSDFGWQELLLGVVSGFNSTPNYNGVYFTFETDYIDIKYGDSNPVASGNARLFSDLNQSFYIRGKGNIGNVDKYSTQIVVHLQSDVLQGTNEITLPINCVISKGATEIIRADGYTAAEREKFVLDIDAGTVAFDKQLYTDQKFKSISYKCSSTTIVVSIAIDEDNPYVVDGSKYYLNLKVTPLSVGTSAYTIYLDNGASISSPIIFNVTETLTPDTTAIYLLDSGNENVTEYSYSREEDAEFDNILTLEILNTSTKSSITFGSVANLVISANTTTGTATFDLQDLDENGEVVSGRGNSEYIAVAQSGANFRITTLANGNALVSFTLTGVVVNDFKTEAKELKIYVYVSSYSLVSEFTLTNGSASAIENTVYYGSSVSTEAKSVSFNVVAKNENSTNFNQYFFENSAARKFYENSTSVAGEYSYTLVSDDIYTQMQTKAFEKQFVFFYATLRNNTGYESAKVSTTVYITKSWNEDGTWKTDNSPKEVTISISNGLMFYANDFIYEYYENNVEVASYRVHFSNIFVIGRYAEFDIETFTYTYTNADQKVNMALEANISQRKLTKRYNSKITVEDYVSVDSVSLAVNMTEINLSSSNLSYSFGVYIYPTTATNKKIKAQFVLSSGYDYAAHGDTEKKIGLVETTIKEEDSGVYTITVSCEKFYKAFGDKIVTFTDDLSGTLYIYPEEWGNSYTTIGSKEAKVIKIQYCNGSESNPYVLETADDVLEINSSETMLKSHYKISSTIDMSSAKSENPIGILGSGSEARLVGFSGSIIGTTSQAGLTNIVVSNTNFSQTVDGVLYAGLFAQIGSGDDEQTARIENVSFSGKVELIVDEKTSALVSILAAINKGKLENVGVTVKNSAITTKKSVTFGAVAAQNYGYIVQDFTAYDGSVQNGIYNGLSSKNLVYFGSSDELVISTDGGDVIAGGIAGISYGRIERILSTAADYKLYGYSAYSAYTKISVKGSASSDNVINLGGAIGQVLAAETSSKISGQLPDGAVNGDGRLFNLVQNLLVGGEVSTLTLSDGCRDAVGGLVGYTNTNNVANLKIIKNITRSFVRGNNYVGAVCGFDYYSSNDDHYVIWGNGDSQNQIQAVDDGRTAFYASMVIKGTNYSYDASKRSVATDEVYYAIGNALKTDKGSLRDYKTTNTTFSAISYVDRELIKTSISTGNTSTDSYYGDCIVIGVGDNGFVSSTFTKKDATIGEISGDYKMTAQSTNETNSAANIDVYMLYYFAVQSRLDGSVGALAQDEIENLNYFTPNSIFYPFSISNRDVTISTSSSELSVDVNGNITVKNAGFTYITLSSILNTQKEKKVYLYIVNYFDKDSTSSLFYTRPTVDGVNVTNGSIVNIYGKSNTNLYLVPSYSLEQTYGVDDSGNKVAVSPKTADGDAFSITSSGILTYKNVSYVMATNSQLVANAEFMASDDVKTANYSVVQTNKQTIIFAKSSKADSYSGDDVDSYTLSPVLQIKTKIEGVEYVFYYELSSTPDVNVEVRYKNAAESINLSSTQIHMRTNDVFSDEIYVDSANTDEVVFYEIYKVGDNGGLVQSRLPSTVGQYYIDSKGNLDNWTDYMNTSTSADLFEFNFTKSGNVFGYTCKINSLSTSFLNRANQDIYGEYRVYFYASELDSGVSAVFKIFLSEAEVNYIDVTNYSDKNDLSTTDEILVPSQTGLLEIAVDPVEATFNTITISNSSLNYQKGATEAAITFVYEKNEGEVEFVSSQNFGTYQNGALTFSYQDMITYFNLLNRQFNSANGVNSQTDKDYKTYVEYSGKVYVAYYMPSNNVEDGTRVGFDISVTYGEEDDSRDFSISLVTKLSSYAKLSFANKTGSDGIYYVARGLSYSLTMDSYGYASSQISVKSSDNTLVEISGGNGKYTLDVSSTSINYGGSGEPGKYVEITTYAEKTVDNVTIPYTHTLKLYVMEYVMNYTYVAGVNEDIVAGMDDGTIYVAVGNPYALEFSIRSFLEYDTTNSDIESEVDEFVSKMTQNIAWSIYYGGTETALVAGKTIRNDYYSVNGLTFTPLRIYNPETKVYYLSAGAHYTMKDGLYSYSESVSANRIYTEFVFDVHEQSTQDSPIPIETYDEFIAMKAGEWYILTSSITLVDSDYAQANGIDQFSPISTKIAGLDGNGKNIKFSGTYDFSGENSVGVFSSVDSGTILQNVEVCVASDTVLKTDQSTFTVGLLAASNEGTITNCEAYSSDGAKLSVSCSTSTSGAYAAGLVGTNSGYITNSRAMVNIYSNVNVAGFVGVNSGIISSSAFKNASLKNETNTTSEFTAGFAISNSGKIYTSYVSGNTSEVSDSEQVYYQGTLDTIRSSNNIAGFVYSNSGLIDDCYSNIVLRQSGAFSAGFVFENSSEIARCFSTSTLESNQTSNYGFIRTNSIGSNYGLIEGCYYLSDSSLGVNVSIGVVAQDERIGLETLTAEQFGDISIFEDSNYVICEGGQANQISSVWFIQRSSSSIAAFSGTLFDLNRPELVAPNIIASSVRELDHTEEVVDSVTGATSVEYVYTYVSGYPALGSVRNPILISDAETMEKYITNENNEAGYNYSYYRLINNIDYSQYQYNSKLYETKFMGYLEGNFMEISGISLISSDNLNYAGMFAEVGRSALIDAVGTLLNFTVKPVAVAFANTNVVGGVVGRLDGGTIENVHIASSSQSTVVVSGNNIVGGLVGLALGNYKIQSVSSELSAKARKLSVAENNEFNETAVNFDVCSMAGSVAGVLSGTGSVVDVVTDSAVSVLANKAGLMFGFIDENASVEQVRLTVSSGMIVNAHNYGGLVAGQSSGTIKDVVITSNVDAYTDFMKTPKLPTAVGGVVGLLSGGTISDITTDQSISVSSQSDSTGISYLGGIVGQVNAVAEISNVTITNVSLVGFGYAGGIVGALIETNGKVSFKNITFAGSITVQGHSLENVGAGGLVGLVDEESTFDLSSSKPLYVKTTDTTIIENKTYYTLSDKEYSQVSTPESGKLSTYYEKSYPNKFDVTISSTIYTYSENSSISIGAIVGHNASLGSSYAASTASKLVATVNAYEMSEILDNKTSTMIITKGDALAGTSDSLTTTDSITLGTIENTNCEYYCDVTFTSPDSAEQMDIVQVLTVNNVGDAKYSLLEDL